MQDAKISVALARDIVFYLESQGIRKEEVCQSVGLSLQHLEDPDALLSGQVLKALWQEGIRRTGDMHLGLHIGEAFDLPRLGIVGYVLLSCPTFGQALEQLSRYTCLFSQGIRLHLHRSPHRVQCDCEIVESLSNYLQEDPSQPIESTFAALMQACLALTGKPLQPHAVWFQHPAPPQTNEHERIFSQVPRSRAPTLSEGSNLTVVHFSRPINCIIFDARTLERPILSSHRQLHDGFRQQAEQQLSQQHHSQSWSERVTQLLVQGWQQGIPTLEALARSFQVSPRHLQRQLQSEGSHFQGLLDQVRRELALKQLRDPSVSIQTVAFGLGFSEPSAFHRAFKRWTGQTPQSYRSQSS